MSVLAVRGGAGASAGSAGAIIDNSASPAVLLLESPEPWSIAPDVGVKSCPRPAPPPAGGPNIENPPVGLEAGTLDF